MSGASPAPVACAPIHGRALVLGDDTRSFLTVVRSLGRSGIEVHAAPANFRAPALSSRYIRGIHRLPAWTGSGTAWLAAMEALLRTGGFDLVVPCNETSLLPLYEHRALFSPLARLAIPGDEAIAAFFDKHATRELARSVGVAVPPGRLARRGDTGAAVLAELGAPVVVKPRHSYRLETLHHRGKVRVLHTAEALDAALGAAEPEDTLLEGFHPGDGLGVSILAHDGRVLQGFEHHRVREIEGASYYRVSAALDPTLSAGVAAMVAAVRFSGIAMFEYKRSPDAPGPAGAVLLEVNARPWGSMPLPVALGVDFPARWYRQIVRGELSSAVPYPAGIYGRNLVPDLWAIRASAGRLASPVARLGFVLGRLWDMRRILTGREKQDVFVWDDPRPALTEVRQLGADISRRALRALPGHGGRLASRAQATVRDSRRHPGTILFVCHGNICRSPFAEVAFRRTLQAPRGIASRGTMPLAGRPSPGLALEAAARRGLDLSQHRSQPLTAEEAEGAALIVIFDGRNREMVLDQVPAVAGKLVLLGHFIGAGEIVDPVDGDARMFDRVYEQIERSIVVLNTAMQ